MSPDPGFRRRLRRLILISSVSLGMITALALATADVGLGVLTLLLGGWGLMPGLLWVGLEEPGWRSLLPIPAVMFTVALLIITIGFDGPGIALAGWWMITAGVVLGATLAIWFWYRRLPVPERLDDPFAPGRWLLISVHVGLIVLGLVLVLSQTQGP
jgi:hypothetical protein